jgi:hypothetical protein
MRPEEQLYEGHRIEVRVRAGKGELVIDGVPVAYGQLPSGLFFLHDYAYDWSPDLVELGRRYIAYRRRVGDVRARQRSQREK